MTCPRGKRNWRRVDALPDGFDRGRGAESGLRGRPTGCSKLAGTSDRYRIRVGDYRIVYRIDDGKVTVLVLVIGHRREVYDG